MTALVLTTSPLTAPPNTILIQGIDETNFVLKIQDPLVVLSAASRSLLQAAPAKKITKRRRKFNMNTSCVLAGGEAESETKFFSRLTGASSNDTGGGFRGTGGVLRMTADSPGTENDIQSTEDEDKVRTDIRELQYAMRDVMEALDEQQRLQISARNTDKAASRTNLPAHGEYCELFDGQYLHVYKDVVTDWLPIAHGLGRVPQGAIVVRNPNCQVLIEGSGSIPPATKDTVYAKNTGSPGNFSIFILF